MCFTIKKIFCYWYVYFILKKKGKVKNSCYLPSILHIYMNIMLFYYELLRLISFNSLWKFQLFSTLAKTHIRNLYQKHLIGDSACRQHVTGNFMRVLKYSMARCVQNQSIPSTTALHIANKKP